MLECEKQNPKYQWMTYRILTSQNGIDAVCELTESLNKFEADGWEIFQVMPFCNANLDFVVVIRLKISTFHEGLALAGLVIVGGRRQITIIALPRETSPQDS